jgi:hypothetical protein
MRRQLSLILAALLFIALSIQSDAINRHTIAVAQNRDVPAPEEVLGFRPGDDRKLASWSKIVEYFQKLDAASDRVKFEEIGKTTMGAPYVFATISAPENLSRLDEFKEIQRQLADPRILGSPRNPALADQKARQLIARGKTIVLITCGIHSTEVGSTLSSTLIAHRLASSNEPEIQEILRNTIILLVPSTNPDGVDIVKNWYDKTLGTPYEGAEQPELYHKYVGHDNNRDWYAFTQVETQLAVDKLHNVWHPQIVHDIHQQGPLGSRLFLPPYMPPVEPNVPKKIVEGYTELGSYMAAEMRKAGFQGITTNSTYDAWSPSRAYSHYHGGVRILSETASARLATPLTVKFEQLNSREGYDPKKASANFGPVWRGGEWRLRDITNTMTTAAFFLLKHSAQNREAWLRRFYEIGKEAVRPRGAGNLVALVVPYRQDATPQSRGGRISLLSILERGGVEAQNVKAFRLQGNRFAEGTAVIRIDQPYGLFAKALLERQVYPNLRDREGHPIQPYDATSHTLSLLMDVQATPVYTPVAFKPSKIDNAVASLSACGRAATYGLYRSFVPSMDEGWTRWIFENRARNDDCFRFESLTDPAIKSGALNKYPAIVIPDQPRAAIVNGHRSGTMPPEYTGGLGPEGVKALREFVEQGGTLICLNRASDFAIEQFKLPIRDVTDGLPRTQFFVPGSILRIELDTSNPIANGMPRQAIAWVENSPVFEISGTGVPPVNSGTQSNTGRMPVPQVKIIAWYPKNKDPLLSGWLLGGDRIQGKAALVEVGMGKGRIILFGFRPQYRGQSLATYPLFFNAITGR